MEEDKTKTAVSAGNSPMLDRSQLLTPVENPRSGSHSSESSVRSASKSLVLRVQTPENARFSTLNQMDRDSASEPYETEMSSFTNSAVIDEERRGPGRIDSLYLSEAQAPKSELDLVDQSLHQIARDGDVRLMTVALKGLSVSQIRKRLAAKDAERHTPLHYAARYNHLDMCKLLVEYGANIHAKGEDNMTPLHLVAKSKPKTRGPITDEQEATAEGEIQGGENDTLEILRFLLSSGGFVNEKDFYDFTPLHHSCLRGNTLIVQKLLECRGILIEAMDKQQMTPLHIASVYGQNEIARILIKAGCNIRCKDEENGTPLHLAAAEGNLQIVKLLLEGAEDQHGLEFVKGMLSDMDNDSNTPLHLAVDSGHAGVTRYLIAKCKSVGSQNLLNARRSNNETPIHLAASHGHLEIVRLLVNNAARINIRDAAHSTPLILASKFNQFNVVEYLLQCGAKIDIRDVDDFTALLIAANYGHPETISLLIEHGTDVTAVDKNERTVLHQCAEESRLEAMQELLRNAKVKTLMDASDRYGNTALHIAAENGSFALLKVLLEARADCSLKNEDEQTPLHLAAIHGRVRVIKELVRHDKNVIHADDENANTALHLAALAGRIHCVQELVNAGANIGARNVKQWTPLDCCASAGHSKSAVVLLEADSPVDPKDKRRITPLHLASREGHSDMVKLLLKWNADVSLRSLDGRNALDFATDSNNEECAMAIVESEHWREALMNRTKNIATGMKTQTLMRKLIRKMPSVAEAVFRNCLKDNGKHPDHPRYEITFDYEFLDDEFSCTPWIEQSDTMSEHSIAVSSDVSYEIYDESGSVNREAIPYESNSEVLMKNHCLSIMVQSKRESLLRHPLVISLLKYKWKSYGRTIYYVNLLLYTLFMAVLNSYVLTVPPPYAINRTSTTVNCVLVVDEATDIWGTSCPPQHAFWQPVAKYIIYVLAAFSLLKEAFQILSMKLNYFLFITNLVELSLYILSILLVYDVSEFAETTGIREDWQWQCGAAAVFLSWMGLILFIQNFPRFGIYVLMFTDIFKTFVSFFAVFLLFIFGFAFSFHALFQNQFAFEYWWNSIIKTVVMMIGEFEYDALFNSERSGEAGEYTIQVFYEALSYIIFVLFLLIMSIITMNLLVGLAVDDIKDIQDHAKLEGLAMQVKLALDVEYTLPQFLRRHFLKKYNKLMPNQYRNRNRIVRWFAQNEDLTPDRISQALNPERGDLEIINDKVDNLKFRIQTLRTKIRDMSVRSQTIESMLKAVISHLKINWSDDNDDEDS